MSTYAPAPPAPPILRMAAPLVVSFWMRAAFTFVDTAYAATIGDAAVGAIGLTVPFEFLMIAVWVGLSTGLTSCLSRAMGANESEKVAQYLRACRLLVTLAAPAFALVGGAIWLLAPRISLAGDVAASFRVYGAVLIGGSALTTFWSVGPDSLIKAHQDTRSTMWAGIWSNVINLALNTLFLFVFHWGVFGIALSTVLGRIGGLAYAVRKASRHEARRLAAQTAPAPGTDPAPYRSILALAIPSSLTFALMAAETALVNWLLSRMENAKEAIAAYSIYYRVALFALNPVIAAGVAMLPFSARRFGEGDVRGVRRGLRQAGIASVLYSLLVVAPLALLLGDWLAALLAESPLSVRYTSVALRLVPFYALAGTPFLLNRPVFEGMGRGAPGLAMAALRYLLLTLPGCWAGMEIARSAGHPQIYGLVGGLLAVAAVASAVFSFWLWRALVACERAQG